MSETVKAVIKYVLLGLSAVTPVLFLVGVIDLELFLGLAYVYFAIAIGLAIIFPIVNMIVNPTNSKKTLLGLGALVLLFVVAFLMSSSAQLPFSIANPANDAPVTLRFVDTSVISLYLLAACAVGSIVYTE
ncbi:MAG TPA: hypothetical protein VMV56_00015, partial [Williamwhitmania sp.]|nr:hypothetical protein [Williamwhitmania sp.]